MHDILRYYEHLIYHNYDNIFIERFWRNIKYEKIYPEPSEDGHELYSKIKWYMEFYNTQRGHQSLDYKRPKKVFQTAA